MTRHVWTIFIWVALRRIMSCTEVRTRNLEQLAECNIEANVCLCYYHIIWTKISERFIIIEPAEGVQNFVHFVVWHYFLTTCSYTEARIWEAACCLVTQVLSVKWDRKTFIIVFTSQPHWSDSWARWILSIPSHLIYFRSSHQSRSSCLFPLGFRTISL
jgi:hypothetical protein